MAGRILRASRLGISALAMSLVLSTLCGLLPAAWQDGTLWASLSVPDAGAAVVVVDTALDVCDGDTNSIALLIGNKGPDGFISLREALHAADNTPNGGTPDEIHFSIGSGLQTIAPTSGYKFILDPVILDATTQPGYSGTPLIQLDGSLAAGATAGLVLRTDNSVIRGFIVHSFPDEGLEIDASASPSAANNVIQNNWVGIDATGAARPNADVGVLITVGAANNQVGGTGANEGNVISSNGSTGLVIRNTGSDGNVIEGNLIGVAPDGSTPRGNSAHGIEIYDAPASNRIGGAAALAGNLIAHNAGEGIHLAADAGSLNSMLGNEIHSNTGLGIDLAGDGVTANDGGSPPDQDTGPNKLQNYPVLTLAVTDGSQLTVEGSLSSTPLTDFRLEFFASGTADGSGHGEGERFLGAGSLSTDAAGLGSGTFFVTAPVIAGEVISATATVDLGGGNHGDTSEFSDDIAAIAAAGATVIVDTVSDVSDGDVTTLSTLLADRGADGMISLREAITACNNTTNGAAPDEIHFGIAGGIPHTIQPGSALPTISDPVIIDGTTQPGASANSAAAPGALNGTLGIVLDGVGAGANANGLILDAADSEVRGLVIQRFGESGVRAIADRCTIAGNYIGTDASGAVARSNTDYGVELNSADNLVGGPDPEDRNLIAANGANGVIVWTAAASGNRIEGNLIGTDAAGTSALGNSQDGVHVGGGADGAIITRNVVSANGNDGIELVDGSTGGAILGNHVGVNSAGNAALPNGRHGVVLYNGTNNTQVGSAAAVDRNIISGNTTTGIVIDGNGDVTTSGNIIANNNIGVDITGSVDLGNGSHGIHFFDGPAGNTVGGTAAGTGNVIAFNGGTGILLTDAAVDNALSGNSVHDNTGLGIDLADDGTTANDDGDGDTGPNQRQNYPVLSMAETDATSQIVIEGSLNSAASTVFRVEFFASVAADGSGFGEGETYLGFTSAATDPAGDATISATLPVVVPEGSFISATATDPAGNTSEFAQVVTAALAVTSMISGIVFEDVDFSVAASNWDGGIGDAALPGVDVELYDNTDVYISSTTTDAGGNYSFTSLADGTYKVRARSATLGDLDTLPASGLNATVPGTWPYPLPEMTWGRDSALMGGQDPTLDDTDTGDNAGPGDTYVVITVSGSDVPGVNFGYCYEVIVNEGDDGRADNLRSAQGSLRQFIKNANAITGTNRSQFQIPGL